MTCGMHARALLAPIVVFAALVQAVAMAGVISTGAADGWSVYKTSKIVDGIPGNPPAPLSPPCVNGGGYSHGPDNDSVVTGAPVKH